MKLIVGLGNPGEKYIGTRHNLGFMIIDHLLQDMEPVSKTVWSKSNKLKSETAQIVTETDEKILLAKPQTYMNNSGMAVVALRDFYKIADEDIWVIHDELDLPLGSMKIRFGGAAAGHHGVESIIAELDTDKFWRFRMGIGEPKHSSRRMREEGGREKEISRRYMTNVEDFVLGVFSSKEKGELVKLIKHGSNALQVAIEKGTGSAMNRFNTK